MAERIRECAEAMGKWVKRNEASKLGAKSKRFVMSFSREVRSDLKGLGGPERFDRICELFIAAVLWLLLFGLAADAAMRIESWLEMHGAEVANDRVIAHGRDPSLP